MSTIIKLRCIDQVLTFESTPLISSGGREEDFLQVSFCSKWDNMAKTAVFWRSEEEVYHVALDVNNSCAIPHEVLADEGVFYFGLFGVDSASRQRTTEVLRYTVERGAITSGTKPTDPTPDLYTQMLAVYSELIAPITQLRNGISVFGNVMLQFINGVAVFEHASITPTSVCFVQRRAATAGLENEFSFAVTAGQEQLTVVMEAKVSAAVELNIVVFNL